MFDTCRHDAPAQAIIDFARGRDLPVKIIINSHWHLDHMGGNLMLHKGYPDARVFASGAIDAALHGFLADYKSSLQKQLAASSGDPAKQSSLSRELAIIDAGPRLGRTR